MDGNASLLPVWLKAWEVWSAIGERLVSQSLPSARQVKEMRGSGRSEDQVLQTVLDSTPSQALLVGLLEAILQVTSISCMHVLYYHLLLYIVNVSISVSIK